MAPNLRAMGLQPNGRGGVNRSQLWCGEKNVLAQVCGCMALKTQS